MSKWCKIYLFWIFHIFLKIHNNLRYLTSYLWEFEVYRLYKNIQGLESWVDSPQSCKSMFLWHVLHTSQNFEKYALEFISSIKDLKGSNWNFEAHKTNKINKVIDGFRSHDMIAGCNSTGATGATWRTEAWGV